MDNELLLVSGPAIAPHGGQAGRQAGRQAEATIMPSGIETSPPYGRRLGMK